MPRSLLLERLGQGLLGRVILLSTSAGFGKTTLLSTWLVECRCPVGWVSLDAGDNDPVRFLSYVIATLETILPGVGTEAQTLLRSPQMPLPECILMVLINAFCSPPGTVDETRCLCSLAIDDYHVIDVSAIHSAVAFLLDNLPPGLKLVIATRADSPLARQRPDGGAPRRRPAFHRQGNRHATQQGHGTQFIAG